VTGRRDVVRRAIAETKNFNGVNGTWSFDRNGDVDLNTTSGFRVVPAASPPGCQFQLETIPQ
jgi:branched-chain amino acid transport system substrate-binding protein